MARLEAYLDFRSRELGEYESDVATHQMLANIITEHFSLFAERPSQSVNSKSCCQYIRSLSLRCDEVAQEDNLVSFMGAYSVFDRTTARYLSTREIRSKISLDNSAVPGVA
jgi:hypothetical protein